MKFCYQITRNIKTKLASEQRLQKRKILFTFNYNTAYQFIWDTYRYKYYWINSCPLELCLALSIAGMLKKKSKNDDLSKVKLPVRVRRLKFVLIFMQSLPSVYTDTSAQAYKQPCITCTLIPSVHLLPVKGSYYICQIYKVVRNTVEMEQIRKNASVCCAVSANLVRMLHLTASKHD